LSQDIGRLVQDAEPIRVIFKTLEGQLPEPIEEALTPAAFIESHRVQVLKAQKCLADRLQQEQIIKQRDDLKGLVGACPKHVERTSKMAKDVLSLGHLLRRPARASKPSWRPNPSRARVRLGVQEQSALKRTRRFGRSLYGWKDNFKKLPMAPVSGLNSSGVDGNCPNNLMSRIYPSTATLSFGPLGHVSC